MFRVGPKGAPRFNPLVPTVTVEFTAELFWMLIVEALLIRTNVPTVSVDGNPDWAKLRP